MEYLDLILGTDSTYIQYLAFLTFTIIGMVFIKLLSYQSAKKENPSITFDWKLWIKDNYRDFILAFIASFLTLRFFGFVTSLFDFAIPYNMDLMTYGLILGMTYQYTFRKILSWTNKD